MPRRRGCRAGSTGWGACRPAPRRAGRAAESAASWSTSSVASGTSRARRSAAWSRPAAGRPLAVVAVQVGVAVPVGARQGLPSLPEHRRRRSPGRLDLEHRGGLDFRGVSELTPHPDLPCQGCRSRMLDRHCFPTVVTSGRNRSVVRLPRMGGLLDGYPRGPAYDEMFRGGRAAAPTHEGAVQRPADAHRRRPGTAGGGSGPQLPRPGRHLLPCRRGVGLPARSDPALDPGGRVGTRRSRRRAAGTRAGGVPRRRSRAGRAARDGVVPRSVLTHLGQLLPGGARHPPAERRAGSPRWIDLVRDQAGVSWVLQDNLRVPSGMSYVVENRRTMAARLPRPVRRAARAAGRLLPGAAARCDAAVGRQPVSNIPPWCCSPLACTTRPISSTPSWPARWASSWSRAGT